MTSVERWQEVKRIAADALERPERERAAFLEQACTDEDLRAQVEQLLSGCEQADAAEGFLREPAPLFAAPLLGYVDELHLGATHDAPAELQAALAGRYTIERELGRGGMATVYLARDERHHRAGRAQDRTSGPHVRRRAVVGCAPISARDRDRRTAQPSAHPAPVRLRRGGRASVLHHALRGWGDLARSSRPRRPAADRRCHSLAARCRPRAGPRPQTRRRSSGHQAREHPAQPRWRCAGGRLWCGEGAGCRGGLRPAEGARNAQRDRSGDRHTRVHGAGTGARRCRDGSSRRSLRTRRRRVRSAWRRVAVLRPKRTGS